MAQFAGKPVVSINQLPVDHNSASDARSERNHDEIFHAACCAISHFSNCGCIGIIGDGYGNVKFFIHKVGQWDWCWPRKIYAICDNARKIIGIRRSYANARYFEMMADGMAGDNGGQEKEAKRLLEQAALQSVVADFDKVVELSPKLIYAYFNKGNLYYNQNDYTAAISCYTSAISIKPDFGQAYYNRGIAYLRMGNMDKGVADLSRAGELGIVSSYNVLKRMRGRLN